MGSKARPRRYKAITVEWVDACSTYGWHEDTTYTANPKGGASILTRGYLVTEDDKSVSVAHNIDRASNNDAYGPRSISEVIQIPKAWITRMRIERCPWVRA